MFVFVFVGALTTSNKVKRDGTVMIYMHRGNFIFISAMSVGREGETRDWTTNRAVFGGKHKVGYVHKIAMQIPRK